MSHRRVFTSLLNALAVFSILLVALASSGEAVAEPDWERWAAHNPAESHVPDHKHLTKFLKAYGQVSRGQTVLAYASMEGQGIKFLEAYTKYLESIPVSRLNRVEQLTYWLNLYNAGVIHGVASRRRTPKRMNDLRGTPGAPGPMWREPRFTVEGYGLSLEDIEMNILARHWASDNANPMWIYGLSYAAKGSPSLPLMAFYGSTIDAQLKQSALDFIKRGAQIRVRKNTLELSSLYDWHAASIGTDDMAVINHIKQFASSKTRAKLEGVTQISAYKFNWRTNTFKPTQMSSGDVQGTTGGGGMQGY